MNLRDNRLEADHHAVSADKGPEILSVAASFVGNFETELGPIEVEGRLKIIDNKARSDAVERGHRPIVARVDWANPLFFVDTNCHSEGSGCFASRSSCGVEGPAACRRQNERSRAFSRCRLRGENSLKRCCRSPRQQVLRLLKN